MIRRAFHLLRQDALERDMDEEMRLHLAMEIEERVRAGMSPEEAHRTARRDFGSMERAKDEARSARGVSWAEEVRQDVKFSLRMLRCNTGFAAMAVLTLALGIGVNTAVFSIVNHLLLKPLPFPRSDQIVTVSELDQRGEELRVADANFSDWRELSHSFSAIAAYSDHQISGASTILGATTPVRAWVATVSQDFFPLFQLEPSLGRLFARDDAHPDRAPVAVVSHSFWRRHLAGDPDVLGRTLEFWGAAYEVVGVTPPGFHFPSETDIWVSRERSYEPTPSRTSHNLAVIARLRDGVSPDAAETELNRITAALREQYGEDMSALATSVLRLQDRLVADLRRPLLLLLGAAGLVLLLACINLASTLLARGTAREREVAIRAAVGAGRPRLIRQMLTESLVLATFGAAVGLGMAVLLLRLIIALGPDSLRATGGVGLDAPALGFALLLSFVTSLTFGLVPALTATKGAPYATLHAGTPRTPAGNRRGRWTVLVAAEAALAALLLVGAGLLIKSFVEVLSADAGFDPDRVLTVEVALPNPKYSTDEQRAAYYRRLLSGLKQVPGVEEAGMIQHLPLSGISVGGSFHVEGRAGDGGTANYRVVNGGYFAAMGIPVVRGRTFSERDGPGAPDVALVSQTLADRVWPGEDAVGKRIRNLANDSYRYPDRWLTIVGVVGNVRQAQMTGGASRDVYVHYQQRPARTQEVVVTLGTSVPPGTVVEAVRDRIREVDPDVPLEFSTMGARVVRSVADRSFAVLLMSAFAAVSLLLAAIGVYGVVSYSVARRRREIGIRLALGARSGSVRDLAQRNAMGAVLAGTAVGVVGALCLGRLLQSMLYEVDPADPFIFVAVIVILTAVGWLASYLPARRATRVSPITAIAAE